MNDSAPRFSVLTAVYDPEPEHLRACLDSVAGQELGAGFEHVVVDDGSHDPSVTKMLDEWSASPRCTLVRRSENGGIVAASNDALAAAVGEFVVLVDHDDVLAARALAIVDEHLDVAPSDVVYTDHDLLRPDGRRASPVYKPDFSLERLRNHNYITHLVIARRSLVDEIGGFRVGTDGAQDHDLLLRLAEAAGSFAHISAVLLHWRQSPSSVASSDANKPEAFDRQCDVVAAHLDRCGIAATVERGTHAGVVRIRREVPACTVSVVVPTNGARGRVWGVERIFVLDAVASLLSSVDARADIEIVAVIDEGTDAVVRRGLDRIAGDALTVVDYDRPFNFSDKINVGVAASTGDYVLLLNDDTQLIDDHSVAEMVSIAQQPDVGMVGAKLLYADGTLQHGGHVYNDMISHAMLGWPGDHPGPHRLLVVERECSGVTAAAALLRRDVFEEVGGMDVGLAINYNDVDFSLAVIDAGYRVIWSPHASWFHFEQQSGDHPIDPREIDRIDTKWGDRLRSDPFYNANLAPGRCDWLERPGRSGAPPYELLPDGRTSWG